MDNFLKMANIQAALFVYLTVGIYCRKRDIFNNETRDRLTDFILRVTLPCMVFESFHIAFTEEVLHKSAIALAVAVGVALASLFFSTVLFRRFPTGERPMMQYGILVNNAAFAGLPVVGGMYGVEGLLIASIFIIPNRILMWTAGISYFTSNSDQKEGLRRTLANPAVIAVYLGLARMILNIPLPEFLDTAADCIGDCTAPLLTILL